MKIYVITEDYDYEYTSRFVTLAYTEKDAERICSEKESQQQSPHYSCVYEEHESP